MIEIMTASAGSGKTFNLAKNYIRRILGKPDVPDAFRHILAVTFTNKAMGEMKSRILLELYALAKDPRKAAFTKFFIPGKDCEGEPLFSSEEELSAAASRCLGSILHDYGSFSVSTIDTFFQRILKAFSREIGRNASYQVELDRESLIHESVDRILDDLSEEDSSMLEWLTQGALESLSEGRKAAVESRLNDAAVSLKSIQFREAVEAMKQSRGEFDPSEGFSREKVRELETLCRKVRKDYASAFRAVSQKVFNAVSASGLAPADFINGFYNQLKVFTEVVPGADIDFGNTAGKRLIEGKLPFRASDRGKYDHMLGEDYAQAAKEFASFVSDRGAWEEYVTANAVYGGLHDLGIAADLYRQFDELKKEKNVMDLTDSDEVLQGIINYSDTPFIYEKIGVRYEDFLLDEFQDTSMIQWRNLRPLLQESQDHESHYLSRKRPQSNMPYSLIVGDVKQSIYRWRGSDWRLLSEGVGADMSNCDIRPSALAGNYRSLRNVVDFNNSFFRFAADSLDAALSAEGIGDDGLVSRIYDETSLHQQCMKGGDQDGNVEIVFTPQESQLDRAYALIEDALGRGAEYGDIAILVRTNDIGSSVASYLIGKGVPVVSDESLMIRSSALVRSMVAWLSCLRDRNDRISGYMVGNQELPSPENSNSIIEECEEFLRRAEKETPGVLKDETLYVHSFLDLVSDYVSRNGNNLGGFLEEWKDNKDSISSPLESDSVRIMTVHKSKGLEFPYVIYFYKPDRNELAFRNDSTFWTRASGSTKHMPGLSDSLFRIHLSKDKTPFTPFAETYARERRYLFVDVINTFYVAFTRASKCLTVICAASETKDASKRYSNSSFSSLLHRFAAESANGFTRSEDGDGERFVLGNPYDFSAPRQSRPQGEDTPLPPPHPMAYECVSIDPEAERLALSSDAYDYFSDDGHTGPEASERRLGIVLHGILGSVEIPSDLDGAVGGAVRSGLLDSSQASSYRGFLQSRIESASRRGWFPSDRSMVRNEATLIDAWGRLQRPDRVVETGAGTVVIDYKFTASDADAPEGRYVRQVRGYMSLLKALGHDNVSGYLWYVNQDKVFPVSQ